MTTAGNALESDGDACIPFNVSEQIELCYTRGWTDGLPVVPPTQSAVSDMLEAARLKPDDIIAAMPSRKVALTAEKVAANAVMAGCKPDYMPVVIAAVKGLATPEFGLHHSAAALAGPAIIILVNGPVAKRLGINSAANAFGPGPQQRANATIGRALRLVLLNCLRYTPGVSDRSTFGTPGKYTCCIAENEENHPWEPWHVEHGFAPDESTVTLICATTFMQVWNYGTHEQLLHTIADAFSFLGSISILARTPGTVFLAGEHAEVLRRSGWSKRKVCEFIAEQSGRTIADLKRTGRLDGAIELGDATRLHYALDSPEDLMLVCAGADIGALSLVVPGPMSDKRAGRSPAMRIDMPA